MIHYRDRQFCNAKCANMECNRKFTHEVQAAADKWWGKPGAPVAFGDMSKGCRDYRPARGDHD